MPKDWREVKEKIENELDRIMWEEPDEIKMSRLGIFPSGAGVDNQVLGNRFFQIADTHALGWGQTESVIYSLLEDKDYNLEHCKKIWRITNTQPCKILGAMDPPKCPAPWLNLGKLWELCQDVLDSFESIKTKEEFGELVWSWFNYVNRINRWLLFTFPWGIGYLFQKKDNDVINNYIKLLQK